MSLLWREQVRIDISPRQVTMVCLVPGWKRARPERKTVVRTPGRGTDPWAPAIEALREALAHPNLGTADATVILSNHFVRYLLIPWNASLASEQEELAFARMRFVQVYGEAAQSWELRLSGGGAGSAQVATAVERPLLAALTTLLANSPLALRSIQPRLMAVVNASRKAIAGNAWLAIAEPGRLLLGLFRGGRWHSLRGRPLNGEAVALAGVLEQERLLLGLEPGSEKIYLHTLAGAMLDTAGLRVERLSERDSNLASVGVPG